MSHDQDVPLARIAALLADPTRATVCTALLDGRAWTAGELARHTGVSASTASEHLSRLIDATLLVEERQGRHRYVRLSGPEVAGLIEDLTVFAQAAWPSPVEPPRSLRESTRRSAEARARTCYDHLAGQLGVAVRDASVALGLVLDEPGLVVTEQGWAWLAELGAERPARARSRPAVRSCVDWTERRRHLGGVFGATVHRTAFERQWVERIGSGRALRLTPAGADGFHELLGLDLAAA
ncbi:winged helix-turn-helix domain-containing protein [Kitasatospora sp. NPDC047058]|uniref:ArsR/SmtB family transcription factor n=1 Tax=Kitasatospora sp. NPDC047058 TaxID=3155620 RepID=UPI00340B2CBA